ncbi:MAG: glycolate oxidase subunit GlcE, partial [Mariprofundus sp.]|nr:glycolate oxidase subunit GlcE [Mariprofundus sp.]
MPDLATADCSDAIQQQVLEAYQTATAINIVGGNSKHWYGREATGAPLDVSQHRGIIHYQATELIITAKAGTALSELADALDEHKQRLPFDPPYYGDGATLGGTIACGFSGPRRPYAGSCRDFILGCRIINGKGEILRFGGEVMKNVAGFDVSRLMAGSLGTLGVLLDVSMKILPHRQTEQTLRLTSDHSTAIEIMNHWASSAVPITAMAADGKHVYCRICGTAAAVEMTRQQIYNS